MNAASQYLLELAKRNVEAYISNPKAKAAMVTGSTAEGLADCYSDNSPESLLTFTLNLRI